MNFIPENDYEGLLAQAKAMHRIIEAMEKSKSIQGKAVDDLTRQLLICGKDHLESEREANQILTDQVSKLEQQRDQLKAELSLYDSMERINATGLAEYEAEVIEKAKARVQETVQITDSADDYNNALHVYISELRQKAQEVE